MSAAGVDEAGRGPLAGPVVAAAVILPFPPPVEIGFKDSKKLSPKARDRLVMEVYRCARAVGVGLVWPEEIDRVNIHRASLLAMERAISKLAVRPDILLVDGKFPVKSAMEQKTIVSGDSLSVSVAAASIVAKTTRDAIMASYHHSFPEYNFASHKGYGTREHMDAIDEHGPASMHRKSFRGVMKDLFSGPRGTSDE